jgi:hypothetical protein
MSRAPSSAAASAVSAATAAAATTPFNSTSSVAIQWINNQLNLQLQQPALRALGDYLSKWQLTALVAELQTKESVRALRGTIPSLPSPPPKSSKVDAKVRYLASYLSQSSVMEELRRELASASISSNNSSNNNSMGQVAAALTGTAAESSQSMSSSYRKRQRNEDDEAVQRSLAMQQQLNHILSGYHQSMIRHGPSGATRHPMEAGDAMFAMGLNPFFETPAATGGAHTTATGGGHPHPTHHHTHPPYPPFGGPAAAGVATGSHFPPQNGTVTGQIAATLSPEDRIVSDLKKIGFNDEEEIRCGIQQCQQNKDEEQRGNRTESTATASGSGVTNEETSGALTVTSDEVMFFLLAQRENMDEAKVEDQVRLASEQEKDLAAARNKQDFDRRCNEARTFQDVKTIFPNSWILQGLSNMSSSRKSSILADQRDPFIEILKLEHESRKWYGYRVPSYYFQGVSDRLRRSTPDYGWLDDERKILCKGLTSLSEQIGGVPRIFREARPAGDGNDVIAID